MVKDPMGKSPPPPCDLDENWYTYRSLHAEQKSPWAQSRRTHRLTYRGHKSSYWSNVVRTLWENCTPCDLDENWYTYRSFHADPKSQCRRSPRSHRLAYT